MIHAIEIRLKFENYLPNVHRKAVVKFNQTAPKYFRTLFQTFRVFSKNSVFVACFHSVWTVVSSVDLFTVYGGGEHV